MEVIIKKWGNSAAVRIPSAVIDAAKFTLNQTVDVRVEDGRVVLVPISKQNFEITQLLNEITDDNLHGVINFGKAVGRETW
jgi:antitoxin MazE